MKKIKCLLLNEKIQSERLHTIQLQLYDLCPNYMILHPNYMIANI